jgi:hypothetical protein
MSAVEAVIDKVRRMDEEQARALLLHLNGNGIKNDGQRKPAGARAMVGFARRFRKEPRTTASWMEELRAGEK